MSRNLRGIQQDITGKPDEYGVTLLCTFGEEVKTACGYIVPELDGFYLYLGARKPERFATAISAVGKLRRHTRVPELSRQALRQIDTMGLSTLPPTVEHAIQTPLSLCPVPV